MFNQQRRFNQATTLENVIETRERFQLFGPPFFLTKATRSFVISKKWAVPIFDRVGLFEKGNAKLRNLKETGGSNFLDRLRAFQKGQLRAT